jgi:hypothetical protein
MLRKDADHTEAYWASFYQLPDTAEDVFNLCAHREIRKGLQENPQNMSKLIRKVVLYNIVYTEIANLY